jgi:hypothetical protein
LKTQDPIPSPKDNLSSAFSGLSGATSQPIPAADFAVNTPPIIPVNQERWGLNGDSPIQAPMEDLTFSADMNMGIGIDDSTFTWEMIGLGLEEPLPPQETIDELWVILRLFTQSTWADDYQAYHIFRQDTSFSANDTQIPVPSGNESVSNLCHILC